MARARAFVSASLAFAFAIVAPRALAQQAAPEYLARLQVLAPADLPLTARFGYSMDAADGILVVGAPLAEGVVPGSSNGAAIVFERNASGVWNEVQRFLGADWAVEFGHDVAISGERIVVGSKHTGAWVFDRQITGAWSETTWLGILPSPGGDRVAVEDGIVVCRRNLVPLAPFVYPGFDIWEEQTNGTWSIAPILPTTQVAFDDLPARDIAIDGGIVVASYQDALWNCFDHDLVRSGTYSYTRGASGWEPFDQYFTYGDSDLRAFAFEGGFLATTVVAPWFAGTCAVEDMCGSCLFDYAFVTNPIHAGPTWSSGLHTLPEELVVDPDFKYTSSIDIRGNRLALLSVDWFGTVHIYLQELPSLPIAQNASVAPIAYAFDPVGKASISLSASAIQVDDQHVFVANWSSGSGAVHVLGEANFASWGAWTSLGAAGHIRLSMDVGPTHGGRPYMILGSATGTSPGVPIGNGETIPLVVDGYTYFTLDGAPHIIGQVGNFDINGKQRSTIDIPSGLGSLAGITIHHAFVWYDPAIFALRASAPVSTLLVP